MPAPASHAFAMVRTLRRVGNFFALQEGLLPSSTRRAKAQGGYSVLACADASKLPQKGECSQTLDQRHDCGIRGTYNSRSRLARTPDCHLNFIGAAASSWGAGNG
jgi:hypothetical protein